MKNFFSGLALLTVVILLASCQDDLFDWGHNKLNLSKNEIAFRVGNDEATTRAEYSRTVVAPTNIIELPVQEGEEKFILMETVTSLDDEVFNTFDGAVTRGTPIYTENFTQVAGYNGFHAVAFDAAEVGSSNTGAFTVTGSTPKTEAEYQNGYETTTDDDSWGSRGLQLFSPIEGQTRVYSHDYGADDHNLAWPSNGLYFYLQAPTDMASHGVSNIKYMKDGSIQFDYTSPTTAQNQKDILFTTTSMTQAEAEADEAKKVLFYHALCGVKFKVGKSLNHNVDVHVKGVKFINYPKSGTCTITPNYTPGVNTSDGNESNKLKSDKSNADTKSAKCVTWEVGTAVQDYALSFENIAGEGKNTVNGTEEWAGETEGTIDYSYFPESFFGNGVNTSAALNYVNESTADYNYNNKNYEYTFMFIPQDLANTTASIEIEYTYYYGTGHHTTQVEHTNKSIISLPSLGHEWKAGELHTYYLSSEGVYISVTDEMTDSITKSALVVTNSGTFAEYQRSLLCANWVYTDRSKDTEDPANHLVVASADLFDGSYGDVFTGFIGEGWALATDGFYYYRYPINVGNHPNVELFDTYVGPTYTPFKGTHLEFDISVQAVRVSVTQNEPTTFKKANYAVPKWNLNNVYLVQMSDGKPVRDANGNFVSSGNTVASWLEETVETPAGVSSGGSGTGN